jgi:hypothetical protein
MAEKKNKQYDNIIDAMLDEREPDWKDLGMEDAKKSGEDVADWSHQYVDTTFEDDIAESASRHTPVWGPKSGAHTYEERIAEKEAAAPRINSVTAYRRMDEYKSKDGDNDSLMDEVTESIERTYTNNNLAENSAAKKEVSDAQIQKYVRDLLNQGVSPAKVAKKLEKLAEIELFNHQSATDYLQRNAGLLGLAYLEPNTYMDKNSPTYDHTASGSNACVQQKKAWDNAGIKPQAKSVKQVTACSGCQYFKKNGSTKTCAVYGLPVVGNTQELSQIVNHLTAGVPEKRKHAALVQIANGDDKRVQNPKVAEQTNIVKTADAKVRNQDKRASYQFSDNREQSKRFESDHVAKMHDKGASLQQIYKWASEKFGDVDTSLAFRGFVQNLRKNAKGKIVVASGDLKFLNSLGIRNESFQGAAKCASCPTHFASQHRPVEDDRGAQRVGGRFVESSSHIAASKQAENEAETLITSANVRTLHQAGHSIEKIYKGAANKVGSVQAKRAVAGYLTDYAKRPGKVSFGDTDRAFLVGKLGFAEADINKLRRMHQGKEAVTARVPDDVNFLSYPGMEKQAGEKKAVDGRSILAEYDLIGNASTQDIDTSGPKRDEIEINPTFKLEE